jgi:hypothetical protein
VSVCVPTSDVIKVLRAHGVFVALVDDKRRIYTLERDDFMETVVLTDSVGKRYLNVLKRKLNIPIHHFWNPDFMDRDVDPDK